MGKVDVAGGAVATSPTGVRQEKAATSSPANPSSPTPARPEQEQAQSTAPDGFEAEPVLTKPPYPEEALRRAFDAFSSAVESSLVFAPWRPGQPLTEAQISELRDATRALFHAVPVGAIAPARAAALEAALDQAGYEGKGLFAKRMDDVNVLGRSMASSLVMLLKQRSPLAYAGLVAALGGPTAGGWVERLGISPEINKNLFGERLSVGVGPTWDTQRKRLGLTGSIDTSFTIGDSTEISASTALDSKLGPYFATAEISFSKGNTWVSTDALLDRWGSQMLSGTYSWEPTKDFLISAHLGGELKTRDRWARGSLHWRVSPAASISVLGSYDSDVGSRIAVGLTWLFGDRPRSR